MSGGFDFVSNMSSEIILNSHQLVRHILVMWFTYCRVGVIKQINYVIGLSSGLERVQIDASAQYHHQLKQLITKCYFPFWSGIRNNEFSFRT